MVIKFFTGKNKVASNDNESIYDMFDKDIQDIKNKLFSIKGNIDNITIKSKSSDIDMTRLEKMDFQNVLNDTTIQIISILDNVHMREGYSDSFLKNFESIKNSITRFLLNFNNDLKNRNDFYSLLSQYSIKIIDYTKALDQFGVIIKRENKV